MWLWLYSPEILVAKKYIMMSLRYYGNYELWHNWLSKTSKKLYIMQLQWPLLYIMRMMLHRLRRLYSPQGTYSSPISYPVLQNLTIRGENCERDSSLSSLSHLVFISHWLNKEVQNKKAEFHGISRLKWKDNRLGIKLLYGPFFNKYPYLSAHLWIKLFQLVFS